MSEETNEIILDTWYREMAERTSPKIEDEPFVGLMEWNDYMEMYREKDN